MNISVVCPECRNVQSMGESQMGSDQTCETCGTVFVVLREKRWKRVLRTNSPARVDVEALEGSGNPREWSGRTSVRMVKLMLLIVASVLVLTNFEAICEFLRVVFLPNLPPPQK